MTKGKQFLTRDQILAAPDLATEEVFVPEWGDWVRIKTLTGAERDYFEASIIQRSGKSVTQNLQNIRARLCALCIVDDKGDRVFGEEDEYALGRKSAAALNRIFTVAQRLNGLRDEDVQDLAQGFPYRPTRRFAYRLALAVGRVDVDAMLAELTSAQVAEWMAYFQLEPFGERRADLRAGIVASTIANAHKGKEGRPYKPQDFMPDFEPDDEDAAAARLLAQFKAVLKDV